MRLFIYLLRLQAKVVCAIDLDTIVPVFLASIVKKTKRVYDAHELFTEQYEIVRRPFVQKVWLWIESNTLPYFKSGYTVNNFIADYFQKKYNLNYAVIKNVPVYYKVEPSSVTPKNIIYQGAINEGRCFDTLIPAMKYVDANLMLYGSGNYEKQVAALITENNLADKVFIKGSVLPENLADITSKAYFGITIFSHKGLNQYQSLANRFFDYIMAEIPQICVNYPEYKKINDTYNIAITLEEITIENLSMAMNKLLNDSVLYNTLKENCKKTKPFFNWEIEQIKLLTFWKNICT